MEMLIAQTKDIQTLMDFQDNLNDLLVGVAPYGMPRGGRFNYPSDKRRTKENTEKMIEAEKNLDEFWTLIEARWKKLARKSLERSMGEHVPSHRGLPLARTAPWVEPTPKSKEAKTLGTYTTPVIPESEYYDPASLTPKSKIKTRGLASHTSPETKSITAAGSQPDKQPLLKVDKRTLKVFNTIFHLPNASDQPGEIAWKDFLYAMANTGFASQKLYGSIWQFTPRNLDVERSIQFHEPHPGSKVRFTWARRMGRRLSRAYGEFRLLFVIARLEAAMSLV
jgi:hypothetical protein